jgi:hypothetical protein
MARNPTRFERPASADSLRRPVSPATVSAPPGAVAAALHEPAAQPAAAPGAAYAVSAPAPAAAASGGDMLPHAPQPAAAPANATSPDILPEPPSYIDLGADLVAALQAGTHELGAMLSAAETAAKVAVQAGDAAAHALYSKLSSAIGEFRNSLKNILP